MHSRYSAPCLLALRVGVRNSSRGWGIDCKGCLSSIEGPPMADERVPLLLLDGMHGNIVRLG